MLNDLDLKCLWSIADDYEEVPQIKLGLKSNADTIISNRDVSISLSRLVNLNLAQAYMFDSTTQEFVVVDYNLDKALLPSAGATWLPGEDSSTRLWFYITDAGKKILEGKVPDHLEQGD